MFLHHVKCAAAEGRPALVGGHLEHINSRRRRRRNAPPPPLHPTQPPRSKVDHGPPPAGACCTSRCTEAGPRARTLVAPAVVTGGAVWGGGAGELGAGPAGRAGAVPAAWGSRGRTLSRSGKRGAPGVIPEMDAAQMREGGPDRGRGGGKTLQFLESFREVESMNLLRKMSPHHGRATRFVRCPWMRKRRRRTRGIGWGGGARSVSGAGQRRMWRRFMQRRARRGRDD
jgi:hypothetical protein